MLAVTYTVMPSFDLIVDCGKRDGSELVMISMVQPLLERKMAFSPWEKSLLYHPLIELNDQSHDEHRVIVMEAGNPQSINEMLHSILYSYSELCKQHLQIKAIH